MNMVKTVILCEQVALKWCDAKALRQDLEKNISSGSMHFRSKVLQAAFLQQVKL